MGDGPGTGKKATLKGNRPLLSAILGYGMRSLIQLGRVPEGMKVLENWETLIKEAGGQFDLKKILKQSIGAMRRQINLLSQEKDKTKLNKTINSFSSFLDNVSTKEESNDLSFTRLLVLSYSSINKHQGAVKLLKDQVPDSVKSTVNKAFERWKKETGATTYKAPELTFLDNIINKLIQKHEQDKKFDLLDPKTLRGLGEILTNLIRLDKQTMIAKKMLDDGVADALAASIESDISIWKVLQTYKAREMRLYAETMPDAIKKKEMLIDALSVINQIIESWGKTDLLAIKERLRIFKSMTYYGNVINLANPLANQLLRVVERPGIKDHYFDVMYELFTCYTLYSEEKGNTTKGQKALEAAALKYVLLEQNFSDMGGDVMKGRFEDFIKEHPELQKKIEEIKKAQTAKTAN